MINSTVYQYNFVGARMSGSSSWHLKINLLGITNLSTRELCCRAQVSFLFYFLFIFLPFFQWWLLGRLTAVLMWLWSLQWVTHLATVLLHFSCETLKITLFFCIPGVLLGACEARLVSSGIGIHTCMCMISHLHGRHSAATAYINF